MKSTVRLYKNQIRSYMLYAQQNWQIRHAGKNHQYLATQPDTVITTGYHRPEHNIVADYKFTPKQKFALTNQIGDRKTPTIKLQWFGALFPALIEDLLGIVAGHI